MNILDMVEGKSTCGKTKAEHYGWSLFDKSYTTRRERVMLSDIKVANGEGANNYQRGEASRSSTLNKARAFNMIAASGILLAKRQDGSYWVVDGLQRLLAIATRGDVDHVYCNVFDSSGPRQEAEIFDLVNMGRISVKAIHKYRVKVLRGEQPYVEVNEWLMSHEIRVGNKNQKNQCGFPTVLLQAWQTSINAAQKALLTARDVCDGELNIDVFKGMFWLKHNGINVEEYTEKMIQLGGVTLLKKEINAKAILLGKAKSFAICGQGILEVINHRKQKKIIVGQ